MTIGEKSGSLTNDNTVDVGAIIECRHRLTSVLNVDQLRALGHMIEQGLGQAPNDEALESLDLSPGLRESVHRAIRGLSSPNEMLALSIVLVTLPDEHLAEPIEVCWTGPQSRGHPTARATEPALEELVESARESILVVGYQIGAGAAGVLSLLRKKAERGVRLTFLIDERAADKYFVQWIRKTRGEVEVYVRPRNSSDPMSALHAKCVIVDHKAGMFGSANLTFHGMRGNVEMGILVRDRDAITQAMGLLDALKVDLRRIEG